MLEIDIPEVKAEVEAAFAAYETALTGYTSGAIPMIRSRGASPRLRNIGVRPWIPVQP